jgi:site-specific DNA-methyltransferase (adenine-specific)
MIATFHIAVAMKPLDGNFAQNALNHGVAGLNVDGARIPSGGEHKRGMVARQTTVSGDTRDGKSLGMYEAGSSFVETDYDGGRWPANLIHDGSDEVLAGFPERKTTWVSPKHANNRNGQFLGKLAHPGQQGFNDSGSAARFFKQINELKETA